LNICLGISDIDWQATNSIFSILGTIAAIIISAIGLSTWRRQLQGTNEYELAKKIMLLTYEVEQAIQNVRNPMLFLKKEAVESGNSVQEEQRIYDERLNFFYIKWAELQTVKLETKVLWGKLAGESFEDLNKIVGELRAALWLHFWMKGAFAGPGAVVDNNPERVRENDKVVYFISDDDDFTLKIKKAIRNIEVFFEQKVRHK